ncbi:MAG: peptide deformylase [Bacteroidetes bacterium 41-46]|jgi:peptide deformylase|nr:MAG: peptide deformylase [Bacteroidetes bacterium 41-46]
MILPIYIYGSEVLRERASDFDISAPDAAGTISKLVSDMFETMYQADGVGLAAPQVGKSIRVLVVDGAPLADDMPELKNFKRAMINPVVLEESEETIEYNEGCLSIPDINAGVVRPKKIRVEYLDENLFKREEELDNFACRMVQHEIDHLNGVLFTDLCAPIRKKMLQSRLSNIMNGKVKTHYKTAPSARKR